jgi:hypothetical protein
MINFRSILTFLAIRLVAHAATAKCPSKQPKNGSKCTLSGSTTCKYNPQKCPGSSKTTYQTSCKCVKGKFACSTKPVACGQTLSKCPAEAKPGASCTLGLKCRYNPVGCVDVVKFSTLCECKSKDGKASFACSTDKISCSSNDPDCPLSLDKAAGKACDPSKVKTCNYNPFGCPGGSDPGMFIEKCTCDATFKDFMCTSTALLPCE